MNEIEFRAWDKELKYMVEPSAYYIRMDGSIWFDLTHYADKSDIWNHSEKLVPMQYTGLKDKNDVKIFEGDIIRFDGSELVLPVVFEKDALVFVLIPNQI